MKPGRALIYTALHNYVVGNGNVHYPNAIIPIKYWTTFIFVEDAQKQLEALLDAYACQHVSYSVYQNNILCETGLKSRNRPWKIWRNENDRKNSASTS